MIGVKIGKERIAHPMIPSKAKPKKNFLFPLKSAIVPKIGQMKSAMSATIDDAYPQSVVATPD